MTSKQVFLITGCSSGLGFHLAEHFLASGNQVAVTARDSSKVNAFEARFPQTAFALDLDVTNRTSISNAISKTLDKFGRIDVLINNAGFGIFGAAEVFTEQEIRSVMETNFFGAIFMTQAVIPIMRKQGSGAIIQVGSTMGVTTSPSTSVYSASKFALEGFSEALASEVAPLGIRVIITEPGSYNTNFREKVVSSANQDFEGYDNIKKIYTLLSSLVGKQSGDPQKFALAVEKLLALEKPPVRIPLGSDAIRMIKAHIDQQVADFEKFKDISTSTDLVVDQ